MGAYIISDDLGLSATNPLGADDRQVKVDVATSKTTGWMRYMPSPKPVRFSAPRLWMGSGEVGARQEENPDAEYEDILDI